jgi:hypothetical protein
MVVDECRSEVGVSGIMKDICALEWEMVGEEVEL